MDGKDKDEAFDIVEEDEAEDTPPAPKPTAQVLPTRKHWVLLAMILVTVFGFGWMFGHAGKSRDEPTRRPHSSVDWPRQGSSAPKGVSGCELYPNDPACKEARAGAMTSPSELLDPEMCFMHRSTFDPESFDLEEYPLACRTFGPIGMIDLEDLVGMDRTTDELKPVTEVPDGIAPYFTDDAPGASVKGALVALMLLYKANGEDMDTLTQEPSLAPYFHDLSLNLGSLTEDERKMVGQMLSVYNAYVGLYGKLVTEERQRIAEECLGYTHDLVPLRCLLIGFASPKPSPFEPELPSAPPAAPASATPAAPATNL